MTNQPVLIIVNIYDDTTLDKTQAKKIALAKKQYNQMMLHAMLF